MKLETALYLIPVDISQALLSDVMPQANYDIIKGLRHFIVENVRTARRFLKRMDPLADIGSITFYELNRHTLEEQISGYLEPLRQGEPVGIMSEAGCPAVADPGAACVCIAQREGLRVIPLVGPSSILMSLMASGMNGQGFSFNGYLPIRQHERAKALVNLERRSMNLDMTQIFIETPYRNNVLLKLMTEVLKPDTLICVACDITDPDKEEIVTRTVAQWKNKKFDYDKRPAIFLLYAAKIKEVRR